MTVRGQDIIDSTMFMPVADSIRGQEVTPDTLLTGHDTLITNKEKKSAIEAQIDRSCNDSTIQDFRNNKI